MKETADSLLGLEKLQFYFRVLGCSRLTSPLFESEMAGEQVMVRQDKKIRSVLTDQEVIIWKNLEIPMRKYISLHPAV